MNGKIMLNGKAYSSSGRPSREITMAQWLALPDTKYTDGIVYYIKDIGGANQFPPLIYSDEEREVGVWRDGRPLYQKSYCITDNISASFDFNHGINDFDFAVSAEGSILYGTGSGIYAEPIYTGNEVASGWGNSIMDINRTQFTVLIGSARSSASGVTAVNATIRYVKTTDTPGSGTWTTDGAYAHHYSTSEKVVGTWIDGKPLYEKVVEKICSFTTQSDISGVIYGGDVSLATEIPNIDMAWLIKDKSYYIVNNSTRGFYNGWYENDSGTFCIQTLYSRSNIACKFVIQYTKTTD